MERIRKAEAKDAGRIAEIEVFNYRLNFYPIFKNDDFYFSDLQVLPLAQEYRKEIEERGEFFVYDDGAVKGFVRVGNGEIKKLFVEPVLQGRGIGAELLEYAAAHQAGCGLWALEKNTRAIAFYEKHGFVKSGKRKPEEDTDEYLIWLCKKEK